MNRKVAVKTFLILLIAILIYPPFLWDSDLHLDDEVVSQLPIKKHAIIFAPSIQEFHLNYYPVTGSNMHGCAKNTLEELDRFPSHEFGIVPLRRSIALSDLLIENIIAIAFSALLGFICNRKGKTG